MAVNATEIAADLMLICCVELVCSVLFPDVADPGAIVPPASTISDPVAPKPIIKATDVEVFSIMISFRLTFDAAMTVHTLAVGEVDEDLSV